MPAAVQPPVQAQPKTQWQQLIWSAVKAWLLVQAISLAFNSNSPLRKYLSPQQNTPQPTSPSSAPVTPPSSSDFFSKPLWNKNDVFDAYAYISTGYIDFDSPEYPHTVWNDLNLASDWTRNWSTTIQLPDKVKNNASMWIDFFLTRDKASPNPRHPSYKQADVVHLRRYLTRFQNRKRIRAEKNLMSSSGAQEETAEESARLDAEMPIVPYYYPNLTFAIVNDFNPISLTKTPPVVGQYLKFAQFSDPYAERFHYPTIYPNQFWDLKEHLKEITAANDTLPLFVELKPISQWKFQIFASMEEAFSKQGGGTAGAELEEFKRVLLESNFYLLLTTGIVSALHMIFEFLAFTSDVSHWRSKKNLVGVSVRTIIINVVTQCIIMLYLLDNNENTSWMILFGQGTGILIEAWKITKAVDIRVVPSTAAQPSQLGLPYRLDIKDKHVLTKEEQETKEYDALAFKYVSYGTTPLLIGYTIYSLFYETHRGWYSFVISTLTSFVYAFGFVQLIPQLIINYKLKSVAAIPMRAMAFKFFNTIIDDFFSFLIKMPTLHRLACFRDDVVFLILMYQFYIYRVDPTRANEFGQVVAKPETTEPENENDKALAIEEKKESRKDR